MKSCIQCGEHADTKFCSNCGQRQNIPRLTLKTFLNDFVSRIYGLDGAFPRTLLGLAKNPAIIAKEYIAGIRGKYVGPVGYYFLMFAIFLLIVELSDLTLADYFPKTEEYADSFVEDGDNDKGRRAKEISLLVKGIVYRNIQYVAVIMVPFFALWCLIWFRRSKYNWLETVVFVFFIHGEAIILNILGFFIFYLTGFKHNGLVTFLTTVYYVLSVSLFYRGKIQLGAVVKGVLAYAMAYISFFILLTIIVTLGIMASGRV